LYNNHASGLTELCAIKKSNKMTHTFQLSGITCGGCAANVKNALLALAGVTSAEISNDHKTATITMEQHIPLSILQQALSKAGDHYKIGAITENIVTPLPVNNTPAEKKCCCSSTPKNQI
jgi:copper chaperone CopZ